MNIYDSLRELSDQPETALGHTRLVDGVDCAVECECVANGGVERLGLLGGDALDLDRLVDERGDGVRQPLHRVDFPVDGRPGGGHVLRRQIGNHEDCKKLDEVAYDPT